MTDLTLTLAAGYAITVEGTVDDPEDRTVKVRGTNPEECLGLVLKHWPGRHAYINFNLPDSYLTGVKPGDIVDFDPTEPPGYLIKVRDRDSDTLTRVFVVRIRNHVEAMYEIARRTPEASAVLVRPATDHEVAGIAVGDMRPVSM
ncbi:MULTISPECIES: hypothetical protein [unclassified Bradyrhizobium]|uniref:hypothetical protein n=1 Tax=unclassified Bradyrhizobium TaxID=2631580 RepID=UPI0028E9EAD7|nr:MULTISPECIES: hypothetical protein [unclassified Bradyrhizobium]